MLEQKINSHVGVSDCEISQPQDIFCIMLETVILFGGMIGGILVVVKYGTLLKKGTATM